MILSIENVVKQKAELSKGGVVLLDRVLQIDFSMKVKRCAFKF